MNNDDIKPDDLQASIRSVAPVEKTLEVVVRLSNRATRALHYIADVRTSRYDPATRTLTLTLSDEGREVLPTTITKRPQIRYIDPGSEAEIRLRIPDRIVRLSRSAAPGELAFDTQQLSDVAQVNVDIGWADVPYYPDTRPRGQDEAVSPWARWEQHKTRATLLTTPAPPTSTR